MAGLYWTARCEQTGRGGRALGFDPCERIHRIRLIPTETSRQQPPQQFGSGRASHHRPVFAVVIGHRDVFVGDEGERIRRNRLEIDPLHRGVSATPAGSSERSISHRSWKWEAASTCVTDEVNNCNRSCTSARLWMRATALPSSSRTPASGKRRACSDSMAPTRLRLFLMRWFISRIASITRGNTDLILRTGDRHECEGRRFYWTIGIKLDSVR